MAKFRYMQHNNINSIVFFLPN